MAEVEPVAMGVVMAAAVAMEAVAVLVAVEAEEVEEEVATVVVGTAVEVEAGLVTSVVRQVTWLGTAIRVAAVEEEGTEAEVAAVGAATAVVNLGISLGTALPALAELIVCFSMFYPLSLRCLMGGMGWGFGLCFWVVYLF